MKSFDVIIIGGGSAGFAAARAAVAEGASVAVIEGGEEVGGLCILRGCMPSKALLESSRRWEEAGEAGEFGLRLRRLRPDLLAIQRRKEKLVAEFAGYRRQQLEKGRFKFLRGQARFLDSFTLEVTWGQKKQILNGKAFVIATGSEITQVKVPGLSEAGYWTSDEALLAKKVPKRLAVLGGGVVAVELGQFFSQLGAQVTLLQRSPFLVKEYDEDVSATLRTALEEKGMVVRTKTKLRSVEKRGKNKIVWFEQGGRRHQVVVDEVLYALGRQPAVQGLELAQAGVALDGNRVAVDERMRCTAPHIFAAGDVVGLWEVVHIAVLQGEVAGYNAARIAGNRIADRRQDNRLTTTVVFTEPQIAHVGLTEKEARDRKVDYVTASYPFNDHGKSQIHGTRHGFVKLLAEKKRGEIIGAQIIGPHASELIHELIAVMRYRGTAAELAAMPHYHPTLAEIVTYPAEDIVEQLGK
jgi:pyruvate/2-oxoglutarate dehydrogenase complex dihydrolipoamide dehydrogenase (E3) component